MGMVYVGVRVVMSHSLRILKTDWNLGLMMMIARPAPSHGMADDRSNATVISCRISVASIGTSTASKRLGMPDAARRPPEPPWVGTRLARHQIRSDSWPGPFFVHTLCHS
jgi:hypothetical protein